MRPDKSLPISDEFASEDDYVEAVLQYASTNDVFQILSGGIHILDFFISEPGLFYQVIPDDWQGFLLECEPMAFLDFLMRDNLDSIDPSSTAARAPSSLIQYVQDIRRFSLRRNFTPRKQKLPVLPQSLRSGMRVKKVHEVTNFADYVDRLVQYCDNEGEGITHFIDFGSGQNYLGRTLAVEPYNRNVIAVESKEANINGAKALDILSGLAEASRVSRNKKVYMRMIDSEKPVENLNSRARKRLETPLTPEVVESAELRPRKEFGVTYLPDVCKGSLDYVQGRLENGDLTEVIQKVVKEVSPDQNSALRLMAISIHSCGNLSHYGIRSLVMNEQIRAVAIVGCCYNLLTEKLGPPTRKMPYNREAMTALNRRVKAEAEKRDPQGFPISQKLSTHSGGIRFNITARMMACQAPQNWTYEESEGFFNKHFFRAVLQRIFLDKGVVTKIRHDHVDNSDGTSPSGDPEETPFNTSTNPVVIGSLPRKCITSFRSYVRGAVHKLSSHPDYNEYHKVVKAKMGDITDAEIDAYEEAYGGSGRDRRREMSSVWSLMGFSAGVTESLIVTDRWLFLRERPDQVRDCWVETVFDYRQSPRNLVVVGIKQ
jgi:hypothetical protein